MASWVFSSIQSLSSKVLKGVQGITSSQQDLTSSVAVVQKECIRVDLKKLAQILARIQAVQHDAEEREIKDQSVRLWLEELRGVAYQAEDVLDEFNYEILRSIIDSGDAAIEAYHRERERGAKRKFPDMYSLPSLAALPCAVSNTSIPDGMAEKIKTIVEQFENISKDRENLRLREEDGTHLIPVGPKIRPPTSSHMDERATFGREAEKEKIIRLLDPSEGPSFMVLPIVGMGGLGKTTLVQLVHNDFRVCQLFDKRV